MGVRSKPGICGDFLAQLEQGTQPSAAYAGLDESLEKIELHAIQETIRHNRGNISARRGNSA